MSEIDYTNDAYTKEEWYLLYEQVRGCGCCAPPIAEVKDVLTTEIARIRKQAIEECWYKAVNLEGWRSWVARFPDDFPEGSTKYDPASAGYAARVIGDDIRSLLNPPAAKEEE